MDQEQQARILKTLDRALSKAGLGSRSDARKWIGAGRVAVNGKKIQTPDHWVDLKRDRITVDGRPLQEQRKLYLLFYKPKGYLTTYKDPEGRPTVYDLIGDVGQWVSPVGRLDQDSSGLLILTNDTDFANHITDPEQHVQKTYQVKTSSHINPEGLELLRRGVVLNDGPTRAATVTHLRDSSSGSFLEITISEGRNRQVRRMIEAVNSRVRKLVRVAIGPVRIDELQIGTYRELTNREVNSLMKIDAR